MRKQLLAFAAALLFTSTLAHADLRVVASIKPLQSLVAQVMQGAGTPALIVDGSNSPHTFALKPSNASDIEQAEVIFWVGHELEAFLGKPLEALGSKAKTVAMMDVPNIQKLPIRENGNFASHDHGEEGEEAHGGGQSDPHIWLDPANAKAMLAAIATALTEADPAHAALYTANAAQAQARIDALAQDIAPTLATMKGKGFLVFHDAFQYLEKPSGLSAAGAIAIHPENPPGAAAIAALRKRIADGNIACVFAEPQFDNKLVAVILEGSTAKSGTLDPLGATLDPGPDLYDTMMRNLAKAMAACLQ